MIRAGDGLLIRGTNIFSRIIMLVTQGRCSHCITMVNKKYGMQTGFFMKAELINVEKFLDKKYHPVIIRDPDCNIPMFVSQALRLRGKKYDWTTYFGFPINKEIQRTDRFNCAEYLLSCFHAGQSCLGRGYRLINPNSFDEASQFGAFERIEL